eukprot:CCRYP_011173-RA/>CCRYP_011173-RA protein AED:0.02 eAED:0.02 QI:702/1/1/1/0/0.5/2/86/565
MNSKSSSGNTSRIRILIGDYSLPGGQCARVNFNVSPNNISHCMATLFGLHGTVGVVGENSNSALGALQPGDVVRFNRLEVRNCNDVLLETSQRNMTSPSLSNKRQRVQVECNTDDANDKCKELTALKMPEHEHSLHKVVCDMYPSWKEPCAEPTVVRLCRIGINPQRNEGESKKASKTPFSLEWESNVTHGLEALRDVAVELANRYSTQTKLQSTAFQLPTQPCQRRKLRDITMQNMLSHVVVKVLRCEKTTPSPRGHRTAGKHVVSSIEPCITHATLSDGVESEDIIGMGGSMRMKQISGDSCFIPKSISSILLQSLTEGSHVLLTHMFSLSVTRDNISALGGRESLMLVPTRETIATIITPDHPFYVGDSRREEEYPFASQPLTVERSSQLYSMSQQHSPSNEMKSGDSQLISNCGGVMAVVSPLVDIIVDGIFASFREGRYWQTDQSLSKFLVDTPTISTGFKTIQSSPTYRSATILLDPKVFSRDMVVNADGDALKLLCMEVPAEDMVVGRDDGSSRTHPYLPHVGELLRALCEERTPIRWVLEQESECSWFVMSASLIEI